MGSSGGSAGDDFNARRAPHAARTTASVMTRCDAPHDPEDACLRRALQPHAKFSSCFSTEGREWRDSLPTSPKPHVTPRYPRLPTHGQILEKLT